MYKDTSKIFRIIYSDYSKFINRDDLETSAYHVLKHFFNKFGYIFDSFPSLKRVLESCKTDLDQSLGLCYDLYYVQHEIQLFDLDSDELRDQYLRAIQMYTIIQHATIIEYIVKYQICNIFRQTNVSESQMADMQRSSQSFFESKINRLQSEKMECQKKYNNRFQAELKRKREIRQGVKILYDNDLICKDISQIVCQYLI